LLHNILNFFFVHNILKLLKKECVCKKYEFIDELKWGYIRNIKYKNILSYFKTKKINGSLMKQGRVRESTEVLNGSLMKLKSFFLIKKS
jgi:hypothetical protein